MELERGSFILCAVTAGCCRELARNLGANRSFGILRVKFFSPKLSTASIESTCGNGLRILASDCALAVFLALLWSESRPVLMLCILLTRILLSCGRNDAYRVLGSVKVAVLYEKLGAAVPN